MNSFAPIAIIQSTDIMRRSVRAAGPDTADGPGAASAAPERPRGAATLRRLTGRRARPQSGSDQCNIVAAPRKPARA